MVEKRGITKTEIYDITEWDSVNWGKAIKFIDGLNLPIENKKILELGSRNGGMSLFFSNRGGYCVCTDLNIPGEKAEAKHKKWHVENRIKYAAIDATDMPKDYRIYFDYVTFKSVLGGIGSYGNIEKERLAVINIHNVLRDDGYVVFIENMKAS